MLDHHGESVCEVRVAEFVLAIRLEVLWAQTEELAVELKDDSNRLVEAEDRGSSLHMIPSRLYEHIL